MSSPLKCPVTDEVTAPDGRGRYTHFQGGSIYWSAATGSHAVWGAVRGQVAGDGLGDIRARLPKSDELKNADGKGVRQEFEGGTVYWSAATGAHPVWGKIGATWGEYGWENSAFGYPVSDETDGTGSWTDGRGGVHTYRQVTQQFASGATLFWIPGGATEGCDGECTGYNVEAPGSLVKRVQVNLPTDSDKFVLMVFPTDAGFRAVSTRPSTDGRRYGRTRRIRCAWTRPTRRNLCVSSTRVTPHTRTRSPTAVGTPGIRGIWSRTCRT
ncbi:hypothetical protein MMF93_33265 [Streptomyces tubbatahanensis]|uniref:LGFP repeat-containing protein n=1 Tax=Streptomyces tubbatahanensis TaxID=2923272 RepID=A0ABY3Y1W2_9ACTN|nr:hypothetical protein [Streptomyces tubbatahanensis]UNT00817.1 hypothetical protein MMF93_33265 [Streptomyces tubbatahanensis]